MRVINRHEVLRILTMATCINLMRTVLMELAQGDAKQYLRAVYPVAQGGTSGHGGAFAIMPGELPTRGVVGAKIITVFPDNHSLGLPSHQGVVTLFDSESGRAQAVIDSQSITAIRTAAVSAVATHALAKPDACRLALIGTGEQAKTHLEAMLQVRPIEGVNIYGRNLDTALRFKRDMEAEFHVPIAICSNVQDAVLDADIICTVTASTVPIVSGTWVAPGAHINAVGACRPTDRELDTALIQQARLYADRTESVLHEAGDFLLPLHEGAIDKTHLLGELGELLLGKIQGRTGDTDITVFESLGIAIEDLAAAVYIYQTALQQNIGVDVDL